MQDGFVVTKLDLKDGDILVIYVDQVLSDNCADKLIASTEKRLASAGFPNVKAMAVGKDMRLGVISRKS